MSTAPNVYEMTQKPEMKFNTKKTFEIKTNEQNFKLSISHNEELILFEIEKENIFPKQEFKLFLSLEQLIKINKYFIQFDSLDEILISFETLYETKNISIIDEEKEIKIKIINPMNKKEFYINVPLKEKSLKNEIDSIIPYIISLNEKITLLENKYNNIEKKINELYLIKDEYNKLKQQQIKEENCLFKNSNIIKKEEEEMILSWFEKKPIKFNLLMDTKKDGDSISTFYNKCGKKCPIIIFIKTSNGYRFGGFTTQLWPASGYLEDEKSFVFSLDKKNKYKVISPSNAIFAYPEYFQFGGCCFRIYNNCTISSSNYINDNKNYYDIPSNYEITGGDHQFTIFCYEVYQIEY